jgi:hypothetical protein
VFPFSSCLTACTLYDAFNFVWFAVAETVATGFPSVIPPSESNMTATPPTDSFFASPVLIDETFVHVAKLLLVSFGVVQPLTDQPDVSDFKMAFALATTNLDVPVKETVPLCVHSTALAVVRILAIVAIPLSFSSSVL